MNRKPRRKAEATEPAKPGSMPYAIEQLSDVTIDELTGMSIGMITIGEQVLRVGIRPGRKPQAPDHRPLLAFNGIGGNLELCRPFIAGMPDTDTIIFDVPGAGRSPTPRWPYRFRHLARLADDLLTRLGIAGQVDVMGVSWGGGLAQEFTITRPARVRRLVLAATGMGGFMWPSKPSVSWKMLSPKRYSDKGYMARVAPDIYGGDMRRDPAAVRLFTDHARGANRVGYRYQLLAGMGWTSLPWLWRIRQPTLVLAGRDDPLIPFVNARVHAKLLPRGELVAIDDGHLFLITRAKEFAGIVSGFLSKPMPA